MAHGDLEELTLERDLLRAKRDLEVRYGELVYEGLWFSPLREALDAFNMSTSVTSTAPCGEARAGSAAVVGGSRRIALRHLAGHYDTGDAFEHTAARARQAVGPAPQTWARAHPTSFPPGRSDS